MDLESLMNPDCEKLCVKYVESIEKSQCTDALNGLLIGISSKKIEVKFLVTKLGKYLTSENDRLRAKGTLLLAEVLKRLPDIQLPKKIN